MERTLSMKDTISQVLSVFDKQQKHEFNSWLQAARSTSQDYDLLYGHPYFILHTTTQGIATTNLQKIPTAFHADFHDFFQQHQANKVIYYTGTCLFLVLEDRENTLTIVAVPKAAISDFLHKRYQPETFTPAEIHTFLQFVADNDLKQAAETDGVHLETKKTHYKAAATKMGGGKQAKLATTLITQLLMELRFTSTHAKQDNSEYFKQYAKRYLPRDVRPLTLTSEKGHTHRYYDIGSQTGTPVIVLHSMILPDIRNIDVESIKAAGLRMLWPLRHGALAPAEKYLQPDEQLAHHNDAIETLRTVLFGEQLTIVSLITSSWYAVRYIERYPQHVAKLIVVSACSENNNESVGNRPFGKGLIALAARQQTVLDSFLAFAKHHFKNHKRFAKTLLKVYEDSASDTAILQREFAPPTYSERFYIALSHSTESLKHDFYGQSDMGWDKLIGKDLAIHFLHGEQDPLHALESVHTLSSRYKNSTVNAVQGGGQFLYYDHFETLVNLIAKISK